MGLGSAFGDWLAESEQQEHEMEDFSHKINGVIIALLSTKNYLLAMRDELTKEGNTAPFEQYAADIRETVTSLHAEAAAMGQEDERLSAEIRQHMANVSEYDRVAGPEGGAVDGFLDDIQNTLFTQYALADAKLKEELESDFQRVKQTYNRKLDALIQKASGIPGAAAADALPDMASTEPAPAPAPETPSRGDGKHGKEGKEGKEGKGKLTTATFMRARNEALKRSHDKGRRPLLREIAAILPHVPFAEIEQHNERFLAHQQFRTRRQDVVEAYRREVSRLATRAEQRLRASSDRAAARASQAADRLEWDVHGNHVKGRLEVLKRVKEADEEIKASMNAEAEREAAARREQAEAEHRRAMQHKRELVAVYRDEIERKRQEEEAEEAHRRSEEERLRALAQVENEKRVKVRQQIDQMKAEEREVREEIERQRQAERDERLQRMAASVAPHVESDPERARSHTFSSAAAYVVSAEDEASGSEARPFKAMHGYYDETLFQDQRFKVGQALRAAGLHTTDYGRKVLSELMPSNNARPDTFPSTSVRSVRTGLPG